MRIALQNDANIYYHSYQNIIQTMNKNLLFILSLLLLISCGDGDLPTPTPTQPIKEGFNFNTETPNADQSLTITFKAGANSQLYNYSGDVYLHTGEIVDGIWKFVPAEWSQNIEKCKMTKMENNVWEITLSPSIRAWYNSGTTAVTKLGFIIRSADGTKKGLAEDFFVNVTDDQYKPFNPAAIQNAPLPANVKEGINVIDNSTVTLVLYDKDNMGNHKDFAHVVGDFNNWTLTNDEKSQMKRDDNAGCWWITLSGLDASKEYAFQYYAGMRNQTTVRVADPYAIKILDPDNDNYIPVSTYNENKTYPAGGVGIVSVFKIQGDNYTWQYPNFTPPAKDNMVIYEMLLRDFTSSGDINGAMQKLDYLKGLGVSAIELMPVQEFDGNDSWGYNPAFYFAMDKAYGTNTMYKQFIDACHARGMAVILDVVYNHATGNNPFAKMWWDSQNNKPASNNPYFNTQAPHPYSVFEDFNHESPVVQKFVKRNLQYLLTEYKVDGFRFDLAKGFTQTSSTEATAGNYDASRVAILKNYANAIKAVKPNAHVIFELFADDKEETEYGQSGIMVWRNMNNNYSQSAMGYAENSSFTGTYYGTSSRPANSLVGYMESHDEERNSYKQVTWGNGWIKTKLTQRMKQLETNAAFFFTVPGPKMIWQFGEMGYDISIEQNGRTGKKPVLWNYLDDASRAQLKNTYSKLIDFRMKNSDMFTSSASLSWKVTTSDWNNGRSLLLTNSSGSKKVVVVGNFLNDATNVTANFQSTETWYNVMNRAETLNVTSPSMTISVPANSFKMYSNF